MEVTFGGRKTHEFLADSLKQRASWIEFLKYIIQHDHLTLGEVTSFREGLLRRIREHYAKFKEQQILTLSGKASAS